MNGSEFSSRFDILYNNITSNQAPGLNAYEKSVLLTKAQEEYLKNKYYPSHNAKQEGFDDTVRRQLLFENLLSFTNYGVKNIGFDSYPNSREVVKIEREETDEGKVLFVVDESVIINTAVNVNVIRRVFPIHYMEYQRLTSKPLKEPMRGHVWKIITDPNKFVLIFTTEDLNLIKSIGEGATNTTYSRRYIRKPYPIILEDFTNDGVTIEGESTPLVQNGTEVCELDATFHEEIVQRAVEIAKNIWQGNLESTIQLGQRSD